MPPRAFTFTPIESRFSARLARASGEQSVLRLSLLAGPLGAFPVSVERSWSPAHIVADRGGHNSAEGTLPVRAPLSAAPAERTEPHHA